MADKEHSLRLPCSSALCTSFAEPSFPYSHCARAQSSLEALVSFAALLCALCVLMLSAEKLSGHFSDSVQASSARLSLSSSALLLDTAASSAIPLEQSENLSAVSFPGSGSIQSASRSSVQEPLLHNVSYGAGGTIHVEKNPANPV